MGLDLINSYYLFLILGVPSPFSLAFCLPSRITLSSFFVLLDLLFRIKLLALPTPCCNHSHLPLSDLPPIKTKASNGLPDAILQIIFRLLIFFPEAFQGFFSLLMLHFPCMFSFIPTTPILARVLLRTKTNRISMDSVRRFIIGLGSHGYAD